MEHVSCAALDLTEVTALVEEGGVLRVGPGVQVGEPPSVAAGDLPVVVVKVIGDGDAVGQAVVVEGIYLALEVALTWNERAGDAVLVVDVGGTSVSESDKVRIVSAGAQLWIEIVDSFSGRVELVVVSDVAEALRLDVVDVKRRKLRREDVADLDSVEQSAEGGCSNSLHLLSYLNQHNYKVKNIEMIIMVSFLHTRTLYRIRALRYI